MPDLAIKTRYFRNKFAEIDARTANLEKEFANLTDLRNQENTSVNRAQLSNQIFDEEQKIAREYEQIWQSLLNFDLHGGGQNFFADSVLKLCKAVPSLNMLPIKFYGAEALNKIYKERNDLREIKKLIAGDDRFTHYLTSWRFSEPNKIDPILDLNLIQELVVDGLHEKAKGKNSKVFDSTFGSFYDTVALCGKIGRNKDILKAIYNDESIPKEYKDQLKRAVQSSKFINRGELSAWDKTKITAGAIVSLPGLAIQGAGLLASGALKTAGFLVNLATEIAALPTNFAYKALYAVGQESESTAAKAASYTAGTIFAIPTGIIKLSGKTANAALSLGGAITGKTLSLVSYPLTMPLRKAVYSCVGNLPSVKKSQKEIVKNIQKHILETNPHALVDDISVYTSYNRNDRKLTVTGEASGRNYKFEFNVGGVQATSLADGELSNTDEDFNFKSNKNIVKGIREGDIDEEDLKDIVKSRANSMGNRRQANAISNITSQKPTSSFVEQIYEYEYDM